MKKNKLKQYAECISKQMKDKKFKTSNNPKQNSINVRTAFSKAAKLCSQKINEGGNDNG